MLGVWVHSQWINMGKPTKISIVEIGPGRGTLMQDILRTLQQTTMKSIETTVHLIEPSPTLRTFQFTKLTPKNTESSNKNKIEYKWYDSIDDLPENLPWTMFILHELFDALPIHKFKLSESSIWEEILVDIDTSDSLLHFKYVLSPSTTEASASLINASKK